MRRDLARRIQKLERTPGDAFAEKLSALARKLRADPDTYLRLAHGHEAELDRELRPGGGITWQGFLQLYNLIRASRGQPPVDNRLW